MCKSCLIVGDGIDKEASDDSLDEEDSLDRKRRMAREEAQRVKAEARKKQEIYEGTRLEGQQKNWIHISTR